MIIKKYIISYRKWFENILAEENKDYNKILTYIKSQIEFVSHERLVHLVVMSLVAVLLFISISLYMLKLSIVMLIVSVLLLCLIIPYIFHYYFLENSVQKMYNDYNLIYRHYLDAQNTE